MINQTVKLFLVAVLLLMPCHAFALPGVHDRTSGRGYTCNSCHVYPKTIGKNDATYGDNICLTCHMDSGQTSELFLQNDFANPYKNTAVTQAAPKSTSHKWFGVDNVPAAGALPPIDTRASGLNKTGFPGYLSCARCHSVHGTSGTESNTAPYLRMANDQDQMCRNCHRTRDVITHTAGSHPVNISYTSASAKAKVVAGTLLAAPAQVQTAIAGKYSKVKLVNGMVVCSTCHGTHATDSRSSTFDILTSPSFRPLSTSKGYLLRVDARGKTANALNICTNCHAGKTAHNKLNQNVQCNDCHSGHVEYDPAAVPDGDARPNSYLLRRYLQYSSPTVPRISKRQFFRYTGATTKEYYNTTPGMYGVCQTCHYPNSTTDNHFNQSGNPLSGLNGGHQPNQCNECHFHTAANGSFSYEAAVGSCITTCHGFPPHLNTAGTDGEANASYTRYDEATTPHASHALSGASYYTFECDQCHRGASMSNGLQNANGNFVEVFKNHTGTPGINGGYIYAGKIASYTTSSGTCNNVYCHSNGKGAYKVGQKNLKWGDGTPDPGLGSIMGLPAATRCATCHRSAATFDNTSTGHYKHTYVSGTTMGYGCQTCHDNTVTAPTTLRPEAMGLNGVHVNGVKDFVFNQGANPPAIGSSCATIACHSNGKGAPPVITPVWRTASTGACGACHRTKAFGNLSSGGHRSAAHMTLDTHCSRCHTYTAEISATHVNGTLAAEVNYGGTGCAINACHGTITAPTWTLTYANKDTCTKCHGTLTNTGVITPAAENRYLAAPSDAGATDTGKVSSNAKIGAHQTHMRYFNGFTNYSTVDYYCQACHGTGLMSYAGTHADGSATPQGNFRTLASNWGARTPTFSGTTCSNTYCHNPAGAGGILDVGDAGTDPAPDWNQPGYIVDGGKNDANCGTCHKVPGSAGFVKQSAHGGNLTVVGYDCSGCHGHNGDTGGQPGQRHMDGKFYGSGSCNTCHGYPPVANTTGLNIPGNFLHARIDTFNSGYAGGGGYHTSHLLATIVETDGFTPCLPCHPQTSHQQGGTVVRGNVQVNTDQADTSYRFDSTRSKRYNSTSWSCSNVSCHFRPTPAWNL